MTEVEQVDMQAVFNLAARVAGYVKSLEIEMLGGPGKLDEQGNKITAENFSRAKDSPIFAVMNKTDHKAYGEICAEIETASQLEIIGGNFSKKSDLTETFMRRVSAPALRMQELLVSVAVRENLIDEEELIAMWPEKSGDERDVSLLEKYDAPVLAYIVSQTKPQIF